MSKLIPALAAAHAALITEANGDAALLSTARKVESTLIAKMKTVSEQDRAIYLNSLLNAGSLKALKLVPETARPRRASFGTEGPNPSFILSQPASYVREAMKRGFSIDNQQRIEIFKSLAANPEAPDRKQKEDMILSSPTEDFGCHPTHLSQLIINELFDMVDGAEAVAPLAARILKSAFKQHKDTINKHFAMMFSIYDPSAASDKLYRAILTYALLGASKPSKGFYEHDEMERLAKALTSSAGRADIKAATGGLEGWLASGMKNPPAIIQEFERKRLAWRPPHAPGHSGFGHGLLGRY